VLAAAIRDGRLSPEQAALIQLTVFTPCLAYAGFEGSGTHSLVVLVTVSLFPDLLGAWLAPAARASRLPMRPRPRPTPWHEPFIATIPTGGTT
jgi:hypothetical protein